ncbi:Glucosaminyl phosphatidylinositol (GlcN-PI) nositol acylation protein, partial [Ascosphaera pollenicola]
MEAEAASSEHNLGTGKGAFGHNPLLASGGLVRPVWDPKGKGNATRHREQKQTWRRVQDDNDDNEQWILDGGLHGFSTEDSLLNTEEPPSSRYSVIPFTQQRVSHARAGDHIDLVSVLACQETAANVILVLLLRMPQLHPRYQVLETQFDDANQTMASTAVALRFKMLTQEAPEELRITFFDRGLVTQFEGLHPPSHPSTGLPALNTYGFWKLKMPVIENQVSGYNPHGRSVSMEVPPLVVKAQEIARLFEYSTEDVLRGAKEYLKEMDDGLANEESILSQIPTYVTAVPTGDEEGLYLAVDLGGTNFRVCSVYLHGNGTHTIRQSKTKIPKELMITKNYKELFDFMAEHIDEFIHEHMSEHWSSHLEKMRKDREQYVYEEYFDLGFTFSFPVAQHAINKGTLIRWTKGFDIDDAVGRD